MTLSTLTLIEGSTNANVLFTKVTQSQKDSLSNLVIGEVVYQTDNTPGLQVFNGVSWDTFNGNIPQNLQTSSYTLIASDVGKHIFMSGDAITIPANVFKTGDVVHIVSNTSYNIGILCSNVTTYIAGSNTIKTLITLSTRGRCEILFCEPNKVIISGNVN